MKQGMELMFCIPGEGQEMRWEYDGKKAASCLYEKGVLEVEICYDYSQIPLKLTGEGREGEKVRLILFPYRLELWIGDILWDEEWPCGRNFMEAAEEKTGADYSFRAYAPEEKESPAVIYSFENAEGWRPEEKVFVGDCMPYAHAGRYHVLYLKDRRHHQSKWRLGAHQWAHISTDDFITWQHHPLAVEIDRPWEGSICTGSWILKDDTHYLYYTIRTCDQSPAPICRSFSRDGYHFEKDKDFAVHISEKYTGVSARDPKVILDEQGMYHMFLTTTLRAEEKGCLAHLTSPDLSAWREEERPIYLSQTADEPECSDYFALNGWYYLVYSLRGKGYYLFSRLPFGDWQSPAEPLIPCESVPKAALFRGRILFAGFKRINGYAGNMTFMEAVQKENGELAFRPLA